MAHPGGAALHHRLLEDGDGGQRRREPKARRPGCAYESVPIQKIARKGLLKEAPDVVKMPEKMNVGLEPLNETLAWASDNDVEDWESAAIRYLQTNENRWRTWVTQEAYQKIKKAFE